MGKIKQGILGGFKGKVGTVVGSSWNGIAYMRGLAQSVKNPRTAAQVQQRAFFKEVMELAGQLSKEQLNFLFPNSPAGQTRGNALVKQLAALAVIDGDVKSVDLAGLTTIGNAPATDLPAVTVTPDTDDINIVWSEETEARTAAADEYPTIFLINQTQKKLFLVNSTVALASDGTVTLRISRAPYGEASDTFSGFMLLNGSKIALVGFGTMSVTKRPAK